jgi:tellurite resistance protein TehA-like permease
VSLGAAVICFVIAALFKTRPLAKLEPAIPFVLLIGGCGIANVFGDSIRGFLRQGAGALPWGIGAVLLTALAFYLAYCFFYDVFPNHRTTPMTAKAAITLPTVAPAMGGALGSVCLSIVTMIGGVGATILSKGLGV